MFDELPEKLKLIILDLESNYLAIKQIPEGILLYKTIFNEHKVKINEIYDQKEREYIEFIFSLNRTFLQYQSILNHYKYYYPEFDRETKKEQEVTSVSTPTEDGSPNEKEIGFLGYPQSHPSKIGDKGGEVVVSDKLVDLPYLDVKKELESRKEKFGIWISQEGMRHFERLKCDFGPSDLIFGKIEKALNPSLRYGRNGWFTPISDAKRVELKLSFSVQITRTGWVLLHFPGRAKDAEKFTKDFFQIFKVQCGLSDVEIVEVLNKFRASNEERIFSAYIHDARYIDPKAIVKPEFNGAHVKVGEGKEGWEAYVDFSEISRAHFEGKGPARKVENMLNLMSGVDEYVECQEQAFQLSFKNFNVATETRWELCDLSKTFKHNYQDQIAYLSEIEATSGNRHLQTEIVLTGISDKIEKNHRINLETISEIREYNDFAKDSFEKINYPLGILAKNSRRVASNIGKLARNFGDLCTIIPVVQDDIKDEINHRSNQTEQLIIDSSREIIDKIDSKIDALKTAIKEIVSTEIKSRSEPLKINLENILTKLNDLPGLTTKELMKELQEESKVSTKTIYNYLTKLKKQDLIKEVGVRNGKKGRPTKLYALSSKLLNKLKKK